MDRAVPRPSGPAERQEAACAADKREEEQKTSASKRRTDSSSTSVQELSLRTLAVLAPPPLIPCYPQSVLLIPSGL